jgi:TonB-linked SusC/RagA family outer membrane protein
MERQLGLCGAALAAIALVPAMASGQQTAAITGHVTDATSQSPVPSAQVVVVGTNLGTITRDDGSYRITGAEPGQVVLRAQRIGYEAKTDTVTLPATGGATLDFALNPTAVRIDQVFVTATGQSKRQRESGAAVGVIAMDSVKQATINNFDDVLTARVPGVVVQSAGGSTGTGARIRIRGATSVSLSNDPLLIVDGVRVYSSSQSSSIGVGGQDPSRFNDISPENIESIEILKGPAATALYGTAAANGVIQITTKRGRAGDTRWSAHAEYGTVEETTDYPANYAQYGTFQTEDGPVSSPGCFTVSQAAGECTADSLVSFNPLEVHSPFTTGSQQDYGLSVTGGGERSTYFVSGNFKRQQGIYEPNKLRQLNLRGNLHSQLADNFDLTVSTGYLQSRLGFPQNDNNTEGFISGGLLGNFQDDANQGYYLARPDQLFQLETDQNIERFTGSATANWKILDWLSANGTAGIDYTNRADEFFVAPGIFEPGQDPDAAVGERASNPYNIWNYTANGNVTGTFTLTPDLSSSTSLGVQWTRAYLHGTEAFGENLLAGTRSLNGATALFSVDETTQDVITLGGYIQEQLSWRDRLIATAAVRADKNSAFGTNFGWVSYPALSLSWVVGEEPFFPQWSWLNSLRLRTAYGKSGRQPNFRDAITFYDPVAIAKNGTDVPGVSVGGTGNPDLRPEVSAEFEAGLDAGLFNGRASLEFTYYHKTTSDALVARRLAPSLGVSQTQFVNLGKVQNTGYEAMLSALVFQSEPASFEITFTGSINHNKLLDLGEVNGSPITPIIFGLGANTQRHQNGYPLGGYWQPPIESWSDANGDGIIAADEVVVGDTAVYLGSPYPTRELAVAPKLTFFKYFQLSGLVDYRGGFKLYNGTEDFRCAVFATCRAINDPTAPLWEQARAVADFQYATVAGYIEDASFTKLREIALTITAPSSLAQRAGLNGLSLTLAGRNLATWTDYTGADPEVNFAGQANFSQADFLTQPPVRYFTARVNVNW